MLPMSVPSSRLAVRAVAALALGLGTAAASAQQAAAAPSADARPAAAKPVRGGTLLFPIHMGEPATFDCHASSSPREMWRLAPHYSSLLKIDPDRYPEVKGDLASSWTVSPDGRTITFQLHPNIRFHDGSPLTSNDVKVSYDRLRNPPPGVISMQSVMFQDVVGIDAPDPQTVVIRLGASNATMMQLLGIPFACVYSARLLASDPSYPARKVMGSGPFRFVRYVPGQEWVGERFDGYFRAGQPYLDGFRALTAAGPAATNALLSGQVHYNLRGLTPGEVDRVIAARGSKVRVVGRKMATGVHTWIAFNTERKPLDDVRVRRAINLAMDRWSGSKAMEPLTAIHLMGGMQRPGSAFARSDAELQKLPGFGRDVAAARAEARRLLAEAGVKDLKLSFINAEPYPFYGVYLADALRQIGITVDHQVLPSGPFTARRQAGDFDMALANPPEYLDDPTVQMSWFLPFRSNPLNLSRTNDARLEALYNAQKVALDTATRRQRVQALESYIIEQAYVAPLFWQNWARAIAAEVGGLGEMPSNFLRIDLADIWLEPSAR